MGQQQQSLSQYDGVSVDIGSGNSNRNKIHLWASIAACVFFTLFILIVSRWRPHPFDNSGRSVTAISKPTIAVLLPENIYTKQIHESLRVELQDDYIVEIFKATSKLLEKQLEHG